MIIKNFNEDILRDYEANLEIFFDQETNAVVEPGREDGAPRFLFTEVTGYALLDFLQLYSITGNKKYIEKSRTSADWIINSAQDSSGGVLTRYYFDKDTNPELADKSFSGRRIYSFDTAICLRGMVAVYDHTHDEKYLESAVRMGDFLIGKMIDQDGVVAAIFDGKLGRPDEPNPEVWSRCFGAFHSKVGEALVDLAASSGDRRYEEAAILLCEKLLAFQSQDGNFETSRGGTELHPHCYATEGLLHVGRMTKNEKLISAAHKATVWALSRCEGGEIAQSFDFATGKPLSRFRTDALAQVLALASDLMQMGRLGSEYQEILDQLAGTILCMKQNGDGYYRYGYYEREFNGKFESNTRSYWTNMFCLRGFYKYYISYIIGRTYIALLAGGIGSRVWPISCENRPKPVSFTLLGDHSHIQETIRRYTDNYFIPPDRIYILCSENALEQASEQAYQEGVPRQNCIIEHEPKGTIPAVSLALDGLPETVGDEERVIIVTMSDNVISPYNSFQSSVANALIAAYENDCMVSIGKAVDRDEPLDSRFGHMVYERRINDYNVFEVNRFIEKPQGEMSRHIREISGGLAWECGGVIFREGFYKHITNSEGYETGNLAENLLSKAGDWDDQSNDKIRLATALLDDNARFEDFGVPGTNLVRFYKDDPRYFRCGQNVCLGNPDIIDLLCCSNNLVISDRLPIEIYGLKGFVVIDNSVTNTAVIMPIDEVKHLPGLYRLFSGSQNYEPYITGGERAESAQPTTFVEKSPNAHADSEYGLVFAYNFEESISIRRTKNKLVIVNQACPQLDREDFSVLLEKQNEDPKLIEHLVHVGMLANALQGGEFVLSERARHAMSLLCLYHDYGGYLNDETEAREQQLIHEFEEHTKLDRRLLDSRIICEVMAGFMSEGDIKDGDLISLLNDNVNSAVEFLRLRKVSDPDLRDLVITLLQIQDSPHLYAAYMQGYEKIGLPFALKEVDMIFSCLKMAENISNGRWLWKRRKYLSSESHGQSGFLLHKKEGIEDLPFIIAFTAKWLSKANIDPAPVIRRFNEAMAEDDELAKIIIDLQDGLPLLLCDQIYLALNRELPLSKEYIYQIANEGISHILGSDEYLFQIPQFIELPMKLSEIEYYCQHLDANHVNLVREVVSEIYHQNWKSFRAYVEPESVARLLSQAS